MKTKPRIITDNETLRAQYHTLSAHDLFIGRIRLRPSEEFLLLDLADRGVHIFPPAISQQASRSKTFQVLLFSEFMPPNTFAVHDAHSLMALMNHMAGQGIEEVVTKLDRKNAGIGIHLWHSMEELYNQASLGVLPFPFVLQPFLPASRDIRVIMVGGYIEAYQRHNPNNFRNNLHCGGESAPIELTRAQFDLCLKVMERGKFPYAHLDLMVTDSAETYLAEINLRGGLKGAQISAADYKKLIEQTHQEIGRQFLREQAKP